MLARRSFCMEILDDTMEILDDTAFVEPALVKIQDRCFQPWEEFAIQLCLVDKSADIGIRDHGDPFPVVSQADDCRTMRRKGFSGGIDADLLVDIDDEHVCAVEELRHIQCKGGVEYLDIKLVMLCD